MNGHFKSKHLVSRSRLVDQLLDNSHCLSLICAPAGFGKSSLLQQWYDSATDAGQLVAKVTLSEADAHPRHFIRSIAREFSQLGLCLDKFVEVVNHGSHSSPQIVDALYQELCKSDESWVLALDDFHAVESEEIETIVSRLCEALPNKLRLVIASRTRPELPLAELAAQDQLIEIDANSLRFSEKEAHQLLGQHLDSTDIDLLLRRTQGWALALQVAKFLVKCSDSPHRVVVELSGDQVDLSSYMSRQVLDRISAGGQKFLIDTAFLSPINIDLADYVLEESDSRQYVEELTSIEAFFVPTVEGGRVWYRHHPMFAEFLIGLRDKRSSCEISNMHKRAAIWFAKNKYRYDAVRQARSTNDPGFVEKIFHDVGGAAMGAVLGIVYLERVLGLLPEDWISNSPGLLMARAIIWGRQGRLKQALALTERIRSLAKESPFEIRQQNLLLASMLTRRYDDKAISEQEIENLEGMLVETKTPDRWFRGVINNVLCTLYLRVGDLANSYSAASRSLAAFQETHFEHPQFFVYVHLGLTHLHKGQFVDVIRAYRRARFIAGETLSADPALLSIVKVLFAEIHYERNRLELAGKFLEDAIEQMENKGGWAEVFISGYMTLAMLEYHRKGVQAALRILDRAKQSGAIRGLPRLAWMAKCKKVEILTWSGNVQRAVDLIASDDRLSALYGCREVEKNKTCGIDSLRWDEWQLGILVCARLAAYRQRPKLAKAILARPRDACEAMNRPGFVIKKLLTESYAEACLGNSSCAVELLERLIDQPYGGYFTRALIDEPDMLRLLSDLCHRESRKGNSVATKCIDAGRRNPVIAELLELAITTPVLTSRESDIMSRLELGECNKLMARNLQISERTVKFHLQNIYLKFDVHNRTEALSVAQGRVI